MDLENMGLMNVPFRVIKNTSYTISKFTLFLELKIIP